MTTWQEALLIAGMVLVTFGVRYPVLALSGRVSIPRPIKRALHYVPVAVLTAISVPMILMPDGQIVFEWSNDHLMAGLLAIVVSAVSKHLLLTIVVGMSAYVLLKLY